MDVFTTAISLSNKSDHHSTAREEKRGSEPKLPSLFHIVFAKRLRTARRLIPHGLGGGLGHGLGRLAARRHLVTGTRAVDAA